MRFRVKAYYSRFFGRGEEPGFGDPRVHKLDTLSIVNLNLTEKIRRDI